MNWKRIIIAAIVFAIIAQVLHTVESMLTMDFYMDPEYFGVWSKLLMPTAGPPPAEFFYASVISSLIIALIYAVVYDVVKGSLPGKTFIKKQAPQATHSESINGWFWLGDTLESNPRPSMVNAKVPCVSSQALTQREHTMHLVGSNVK